MKALIFVVPVLIIAAVLGLAFTGKIKIPGITPPGKAASAMYGSGHDDKTDVKTSKPAAAPAKPKAAVADSLPPKATPKTTRRDPDQGAVALAIVWNEIGTDELIAISKDWKDQDLVRVLGHMDNDKVAKFIDELAKGDDDGKIKADPLRASKLSKALQDQGSVVKQADKTT
ncbi:MAG TPA: hypothetical protein VMI31_05585 [Fimbriimonadaceae bacterium]|nr:hypothetical protein [Fimbriimonadaceae bacterium]